jgi:hypothetical protein
MKDWKNNVQTSYIKSNIENKKKLSKMLVWIKSWFTYCETHEEFKISYKFFKRFLQRKEIELGNSCSEEINNLLVILGKATERIYHYNFHKQTTFDFIGDSIAEVANHKIKHSINPIVSTMSLDRCGYNQLVMSDAEKKKTRVQSHTLNNTRSWSNSLTSKYLTDYAENLACVNFDRKKNTKFSK